MNRFECAWTTALQSDATQDVFAFLSLLGRKRDHSVVASFVGSTADETDQGRERHLRLGTTNSGETRNGTPSCDRVSNNVVCPMHQQWEAASVASSISTRALRLLPQSSDDLIETRHQRRRQRCVDMECSAWVYSSVRFSRPSRLRSKDSRRCEICPAN